MDGRRHIEMFIDACYECPFHDPECCVHSYFYTPKYFQEWDLTVPFPEWCPLPYEVLA